MGCSHCMENSTVAETESHMSRDLLIKALELTNRLEGLAWSSGIPPIIAISGGECTEHPDIIWILEELMRRKYIVIVITNGMWLENPELYKAILRPEWKGLTVQVTNDPRFYPKRPIHHEDKRITYVSSLTHLIPLGRMKPTGTKGLSIGKYPPSFNIRSMTIHTRDIRKALIVHRTRALTGKGGYCTPSISSDGTLVAGESNMCFPIGNVDSTAEQVTQAIMNMRCNRCSLVDNLSQEQKVAIGEAIIHTPYSK